MSDLYSEKNLKSARTFLSRWKGADAELWELTISHKSLRILIRRHAIEGNLLISCLDPIAIQGPVRWEDCDIQIASKVLPGGQEPGYFVSDRTAKLEIICGEIEVRENVKL